MKKRYSISAYDTIPNPNATPGDPRQMLKRFIVYDHLTNKVASMPVVEGSEDHLRIVDDYRFSKEYAIKAFEEYNVELNEFINDAARDVAE